MADPFVAEIRILPFSFAPKGWAFCDGTLMPLAQNTALFALLGTAYGGNGTSTFGLPDLRDRTPLQQGQGPGLSLRYLGETGGLSSVALTSNEFPGHNHQLQHSGTVADSGAPGSSAGFGGAGVAQVYAVSSGAPVTLQQPLAPAGNGLAHNNRQPYLALHFCIALQGVFPQRP